MKPKLPLLVGTHLLALGIAWSVARNVSTADAGGNDAAEAAPSRSKSAARDRDPAGGGDGAQLLSTFMQQEAAPAARGKDPVYEKLKTSLPEADDLKAAVVEAIRLLSEDGSEGNQRMAEMEVRALHWLRRDPSAALEFFKANRQGPFLRARLSENVLPDVFAELGVMKCIGWATEESGNLEPLLGAATLEIKTGGIALLEKLMAALQVSDPEGNYREMEVPENGPAGARGEVGDFLFVAGGSIPFADKDKLLAYASGLDIHDRVRLMDGFVRSSPQAAAWMMDLIKNGQVDEALAEQMKGPLGNAVLGATELDMEQRIAARRGTENNGNKPREEILRELILGDVNQVLATGRDWRYEFRNGTATAEEILAAVRGALPSIPADGGEDLIASVYHQLTEENPGRAQVLLDLLPEDKRRARQFRDTWQNYGGIDPDVFLDSMKYLPEPVTAVEKDERTKGWNWKARGFLDRFGDDYVEWVKRMPAGIDKDTAMNSLVWATRERNPAEADKLSKQLYPK